MSFQLPVLLDASNLHVGGGIQVAASFLNELVLLDPPPPWLAKATVLASHEVMDNLSPEARQLAQTHDTKASLSFLKPANAPAYSVAFTVFGPTYRPRLAHREIVGLADPFLPRGYAPKEAVQGRPHLHEIKMRAKRVRARAADHIVVESPTYARSLSTIGVHEEHISVIPNSPSASVQAAPKGPASPPPIDGPLTLIYPARPYPHKNLEFLGSVAESLAAQGRETTFVVTLTEDELARLSPATQAVCKPVGVVTQETLGRLYGTADAVFFPSLLEVSSATPLEALSLGVPIISADRDFIRDATKGAAWYFDPRDPHDASRAVLDAITNPAELARRVALGRDLIARRPTASARARLYVRLIDQHLTDIASSSNQTVVVAHPAQQHSMHTAAAVAAAGYRLRYVTPVYDRPSSLTGRIKHFLPDNTEARAATRKLDDLDDTAVLQIYEPVALVLLLLQRLKSSRVPYLLWFRLLAFLFNKKLTRIVQRENAVAVIGYDTFSAEAFHQLKRASPNIRRILDMSAPAAPAVDKILADYVEEHRGSTASDILAAERKSIWYRRNLRYTQREIALADAYLSASRFTQSTLEASGIPSERIHLCRYGIQGETDHAHVSKHHEGPLRVAFVGRLTPRKGIATFLQLADQLTGPDFEFLAIGAYHTQVAEMTRNTSVRLTGNLLRKEVYRELSSTDVLVFPSLADGFGLSVLEGMHSGTVPIVSGNAGISDLINDGVNGFIVMPEDIALMKTHLNTLCRNRLLLSQMQAAARTTAAETTWDGYQLQLKDALSRIIGSES